MMKMKLFLPILFLLVIELTASTSKQVNILLLHSYHPSMTWEKNIDKAVEETLKPNQNNYVIYTEYMDTKRYHTPEYYKTLKKLYAEKYKNIKFDIILSSDNNAFDFLKKYRDTLFGKVPVVFCGVNNFTDSMLNGTTGFTGIAEQFSDVATLKMILKIHPNIKKIYVVNDYLVTGKAWRKDMEKHFKKFSSKIKIKYAKDLTIKQLKEKIDTLGKDTVVLLGVYFADKNNKFSTYERVGNYLFSNSKVPAYCLLRFNVSGNIVGGRVIGGYSQGEAMAKVAQRILNGEKPQDIKVSKSNVNKAVFNYKALKKYHIDSKMLPKDALIINKPFSLYEEYKRVIETLLIVFVLLLIIFIAGIALVLVFNKKDDISRDKLFITLIRYVPVIVIPITAIAILFLFINEIQNNYDNIKKIQIQNYINSAKQQSKDKVKMWIDIIHAKEKLIHPSDKKEFEKTKKDIIEVMRQLQYDKGQYLIVVDSNGIGLVHPNKNFIGADLSKNKKTHDIFLLYKNIVEKKHEGYVIYNFTNPATKHLEKKITYVSYEPHFKWYIASGVYIDSLNDTIAKIMADKGKGSQKQIATIVIISFLVLMAALIFSFILANALKKIFEYYKKNIIIEHERANTDQLTKIHNRGSIMNLLNHYLITHNNTKKPLSLLMFDIDHFKKINDKYGHDTGDIVLQKLAHFVKYDLRNNDEIGRYGGEEFYVILPDTDIKTAIKIAERLRKDVSYLKFPKIGKITISIGVVEAMLNESINDITKRVDELLYRSKSLGRNRVSA